jgi:hypothetical protein
MIPPVAAYISQHVEDHWADRLESVWPDLLQFSLPDVERLDLNYRFTIDRTSFEIRPIEGTLSYWLVRLN